MEMSCMRYFRMPMHTWALLIVSTLFLGETLFVLFPAQSAESHHASNTPITIKFSCANGSGLLRLDIDRNVDPELVQSINLRSDMKMWMPRGAELRFEEYETPNGSVP
jgi:hypothetical protein